MATLWQSYTVTVNFDVAPPGEPGTTTTKPFLTYDPVLSRIQVDVNQAGEVPAVAPDPATPAPADSTKTVERSTNQIDWELVRGGTESPFAPGFEAPVDDYEFAENVENHYRIRVYDSAGNLWWNFLDKITVVLDKPWLKSISFPFANQQVTINRGEDITYPSRTGVFDVVGRRLPVAVSSTRGAAQYDVLLSTLVKTEREDLLALFSPGDVLFLQTPPEFPLPRGYYVAGDIQAARRDMPWERRWWSLPLIEVAAPTADVVGASITWRGLARRYATWDAVIAENATWTDVIELVGIPNDVVVE